MLTRVHHVGLVVRRLEDGLAFWRDTLGLPVAKQAAVRDQGVRAGLLPIGRSEIELLEPIDADSGVARFLQRRGEGLHHVCFETPEVAAELARARAQALPLIDEVPRPGLAGMICFLHPKGTHGVLVEFATPPPEDHPPAAPGGGSFAGLALREVTARTLEPTSAAELFALKLGLAREVGATETGVAVGAGGVRLRFLSADARAGAPHAEVPGEGLAGLVLEVADLAAAEAALAPLRPRRRPDAFQLDPERCHGVSLDFRRGRPLTPPPAGGPSAA